MMLEFFQVVDDAKREDVSDFSTYRYDRICHFCRLITCSNSQIALTYHSTFKVVSGKRPLQYENTP